jgi:glycosyltransferase involved in cell wall biosynthesis
MALYNSASTLEKCLQSVRAQTYSNKELIVIDGGSTDGGIDILSRNLDLIDYWESKPDRGIYHAWNKALDHVIGEWVHFLGADDYFPDPHVLELVAEKLRTCDPGIRVVYGMEALVSSSGDTLEVRGDDWDRISARFLSEGCLPHTAAFHHISMFADLGRFDESFRIGGDYELLLRELKDGQALFLPELVVKAVTCSGVSMNWDSSLASIKENARARKKNGIFPYRPAWLLLVLKALFKKLVKRTAGDSLNRRMVDLYRRLTGRPAVWTKI